LVISITNRLALFNFKMTSIAEFRAVGRLLGTCNSKGIISHRNGKPVCVNKVLAAAQRT